QVMMYTSTKSPAKIMEMTKETYTKLSGQSAQGVKLTASFTPDAKEVAGVKVSTFSMKMESDPNDPNAMAIGMFQQFLVGGDGGISGMIAPAEGGIVQTMSMNTPLLTDAMASA